MTILLFKSNPFAPVICVVSELFSCDNKILFVYDVVPIIIGFIDD